MNLVLLKEVLEKEPKYRFAQCQKAVFFDLLDDWEKAKNLPQNLRDKLSQDVPLAIEAKILKSADKNTVKALISLADGNKIETVLMRHGDGRNTVCVSSQVGCPLGCLFCATGQLGYKRNLDSGEIIDQVLFFARLLKKENKKVTNIVFMGMGEPFLNYDHVVAAIKVLNDKEGLNIGARHISISTIGIPDGIKKIAKEEWQLNLAISLHAATDSLRSQIIPVNNKYPLKVILNAAKEYLTKTNRQIMFEYIMIKDFNDHDKDANQLAELLEDLPRKLYVVNLILYNPGDFPQKKFQPSDKKKVEIFKHILGRNKINVTERYRLGRGIQAACGQLAAKEK